MFDRVTGTFSPSHAGDSGSSTTWQLAASGRSILFPSPLAYAAAVRCRCEFAVR
jgi:hypothetical protein